MNKDWVHAEPGDGCGHLVMGVVNSPHPQSFLVPDIIALSFKGEQGGWGGNKNIHVCIRDTTLCRFTSPLLPSPPLLPYLTTLTSTPPPQPLPSTSYFLHSPHILTCSNHISLPPTSPHSPLHPSSPHTFLPHPPYSTSQNKPLTCSASPSPLPHPYAPPSSPSSTKG